MFRAELTKLKRSSTWIIAFVLPILAVTTGTINFAGNSNALDSGWASFTSQVVLFYGLLFYSMGISLLAATAWRMEHRGTNWNLLLTATAKPFRLAAAKVGAVFIPVTLMQAVLVTGTAFSGIFVLHLEGPFPWGFAVVGFIALVAALPLITVQSLLSMLLKSFAAPVALCLLGCVAGVAAVTEAHRIYPPASHQHSRSQSRFHRNRRIRRTHHRRRRVSPDHEPRTNSGPRMDYRSPHSSSQASLTSRGRHCQRRRVTKIREGMDMNVQTSHINSRALDFCRWQ